MEYFCVVKQGKFQFHGYWRVYKKKQFRNNEPIVEYQEVKWVNSE